MSFISRLQEMAPQVAPEVEALRDLLPPGALKPGALVMVEQPVDRQAVVLQAGPHQVEADSLAQAVQVLAARLRLAAKARCSRMLRKRVQAARRLGLALQVLPVLPAATRSPQSRRNTG